MSHCSVHLCQTSVYPEAKLMPFSRKFLSLWFPVLTAWACSSNQNKKNEIFHGQCRRAEWDCESTCQDKAWKIGSSNSHCCISIYSLPQCKTEEYWKPSEEHHSFLFLNRSLVWRWTVYLTYGEGARIKSFKTPSDSMLYCSNIMIHFSCTQNPMWSIVVARLHGEYLLTESWSRGYGSLTSVWNCWIEKTVFHHFMTRLD